MRRGAVEVIAIVGVEGGQVEGIDEMGQSLANGPGTSWASSSTGDSPGLKSACRYRAMPVSLAAQSELEQDGTGFLQPRQAPFV
jgi:hypothetical protein